RLLRQAIPVTDIAFLDASGIEQLKVSRLEMDQVARKSDLSQEQNFTEALAHKVYYGPVYLRKDSVYMTLSVAGTRRESGVSVVEVNLGLGQLVREQRIGEHGIAYILDAQGRVIVHPDMFIAAPGAADDRFTIDPNLFQRDLSDLTQVRAAHAAGAGPADVRA